MTNRKAWIYGLVSSADREEMRYIGVSINPEERLKNHLWGVKWESERNRHKINWINSVIHAGYLVDLVILSEFSSEHEAYAAEDSFLVEYRKRGNRLTNISIGGRGGILVADDRLDEFYRKRAEIQGTEAHKLKLSQSRLEALTDPEKRARLMKHVERLNSDPLKSEKISRGLKKAEESNDFRARANDTRRTSENREKARIRSKELNGTKESKSIASEHAKRGWAALSPEQRRDRILKTKLGIDFRKAKLNGWVLTITSITHLCKESREDTI